MTRRRRCITLAVIAIIAVIIAVNIIAYLISESKKQTGTEWFMAQQDYVSELSTLADTTDDIVTLYITGGISQEDFTNHLSVLLSEVEIAERIRSWELSAHPIKTGTTNEIEKKGYESVDECYPMYEEMLNALYEASDDVDQTTYTYLVYKDRFEELLSYYEASCLKIYDYEVEDGQIVLKDGGEEDGEEDSDTDSENSDTKNAEENTEDAADEK